MINKAAHILHFESLYMLFSECIDRYILKSEWCETFHPDYFDSMVEYRKEIRRLKKKLAQYQKENLAPLSKGFGNFVYDNDEEKRSLFKEKDIRVLRQEFGTESIRKIAYRYKISSGSVWSMVTGNKYSMYNEQYKPYNSFQANRVRNRRDHTPHPIEAGIENLL